MGGRCDPQAEDFRLEVDGRPRRDRLCTVCCPRITSETSHRRCRPPRISAPTKAPTPAGSSWSRWTRRTSAGSKAGTRWRPRLGFIERCLPARSRGVVGLTECRPLHADARSRGAPAPSRVAAPATAIRWPSSSTSGMSEALEIADGGRARLADAVLRECGRALTEYVSTARAADDAAGARDACPEQVEQESRGHRAARAHAGRHVARRARGADRAPRRTCRAPRRSC